MTQRCLEPSIKKSGGQAALLAVVLILFAMLILIGTVSGLALRGAKITELDYKSRRSYFLSESGSEDAAYRLISGKNLPSSYELSLYPASGGATTSVSVTDVLGGKEILSSAGLDTLQRAVKSFFKTGTGASFNYGVQIGDGGLVMENNSQVNGSVYSNGNIVGNNNPVITGDAFLAGASTISNVTVQGAVQTGQPALAMPISDAVFDQWESEAAAGGSVTCSGGVYKPNNGDSIGPKKVPCDMEIDGTKIVTLTGTLWVSGNFILQNSAQLKLASNDQFSRAVIADNPSNRTASSKIKVQNSAQILGSSIPNTYILIVSRNNSAEQNGDEEGIDVSNSSAAPIYYAPHGLVEIQNNVSLKEVTAYKILLKNSAQVTYESGLANLNFSSGLSGGWQIDYWKEVTPP